MLIRSVVVAILAMLLAFPASDAFAEKKKSLSDLSAQQQLKLQEADNAFNRPAAQRDLRDTVSNQDRVRSFRTKQN